MDRQARRQTDRQTETDTQTERGKRKRGGREGESNRLLHLGNKLSFKLEGSGHKRPVNDLNSK